MLSKILGGLVVGAGLLSPGVKYTEEKNSQKGLWLKV